jgi:hypothetical protein
MLARPAGLQQFQQQLLDLSPSFMASDLLIDSAVACLFRLQLGEWCLCTSIRLPR